MNAPKRSLRLPSLTERLDRAHAFSGLLPVNPAAGLVRRVAASAIFLTGVACLLSTGAAQAAERQDEPDKASALPLALQADNPRLFVFRGQPTVLLGAAADRQRVFAATKPGGSSKPNQAAFLQDLAKQGLNHTAVELLAGVRVGASQSSPGGTQSAGDEATLLPWVCTDRCDLARVNPAFIERLAAFVKAAGRHRITVSVSLFAPFSSPEAWQQSPFAAPNNSNGVGNLADHTVFTTLENDGLLKFQEIFVRAVVKALSGFDNVLYQLHSAPWLDRPLLEGQATRADGPSLVWQRRMAAVITQQEQSLGLRHRHLIAQNISNRTGLVESRDPLVSVFGFSNALPSTVVRTNAALAGALASDADSLNPSEAWRFVFAGGGLYRVAPSVDSRQLESLGGLAEFIKAFGPRAAALQPAADVVLSGAAQTTAVLGAKGQAYAVYLEGPAGQTLALDLPYGAYEFRWFDPVAKSWLSPARRLDHIAGSFAVELPEGQGPRALAITRLSGAPQLSKKDFKAGVAFELLSPSKLLQVEIIHADLGSLQGYPSGRRLYQRVLHRGPLRLSQKVPKQAQKKASKKSPKKESETASETGPSAQPAPQEILRWSPLGLTRADADFETGLVVEKATRGTVRNRYTLVHGKRRRVDDRGATLTLATRGQNGERLLLEFRAYDDGVAYRYRFPDKKPGYFEVTGEASSFVLPPAAQVTLSPFSRADMWHPGYEDYYSRNVPAGTPSPSGVGWGFPALFTQGPYKALITEAGLERTYLGARLQAEPGRAAYSVRFPDAREGGGIGSITPRSELPWALPWRVILVGDSFAPLVESTLVTSLSAPSRVKNTRWIKPGRSSWSWWSLSDSPKNYESLVDFVDLSAEMGWEYSLVDANWDLMQGGDWKQLAAYAATKNVRLLLWYNSGGPHNRVTERPRDRMSDRAVRRAEMKRISEAGIAGIKVDFFHSDKQDRIGQYLDILEDAADFKLLVNFHGCTLPRGWSRTYPHMVGMESVLGAEVYKFGERFGAAAPAHNTDLVFTRSIVGPMDYTPVTFSDNKSPHASSYGHELALSVLFEVGIQHMADGASMYRSLPEGPRAFLKDVPAAWDETRFISGEPGHSAVLARRKGSTWYVAGINGTGEALQLSVPVDFLAGKKLYSATVIEDGADKRQFKTTKQKLTHSDLLKVTLLPFGGFVAQID